MMFSLSWILVISYVLSAVRSVARSSYQYEGVIYNVGVSLPFTRVRPNTIRRCSLATFQLSTIMNSESRF